MYRYARGRSTLLAFQECGGIMQLTWLWTTCFNLNHHLHLDQNCGEAVGIFLESTALTLGIQWSGNERVPSGRTDVVPLFCHPMRTCQLFCKMFQWHAPTWQEPQGHYCSVLVVRTRGTLLSTTVHLHLPNLYLNRMGECKVPDGLISVTGVSNITSINLTLPGWFQWLPQGGSRHCPQLINGQSIKFKWSCSPLDCNSTMRSCSYCSQWQFLQ